MTELIGKKCKIIFVQPTFTITPDNVGGKIVPNIVAAEGEVTLLPNGWVILNQPDNKIKLYLPPQQVLGIEYSYSEDDNSTVKLN